MWWYSLTFTPCFALIYLLSLIPQILWHQTQHRGPSIAARCSVRHPEAFAKRSHFTTRLRRQRSSFQLKVVKGKAVRHLIISRSFICAGVTPSLRVQVTHILNPVSAPLISRPQTEIDVWLANLSADVLISGTYVKPLFVMQLWEKEHAKCRSRILYMRTKSRGEDG